MPYRAPKRQSQAARLYQQKRQRQQRIALVALVALSVLLLVTVGFFRLAQAVAPQVMALPLPQAAPADTTAFQSYMDREFGLFGTPSLLYYHNLDYALAGRSAAGVFKHQLRPLQPAAEDTGLKTRLEQIFAELPADKFTSHLYFYNPQDNTYVSINGYTPVSAASVIKLPILLDYLMSLDEQLISMDTPLLYADFHRAGGAGAMQYQPSGQDFLANDIASQMIRISDNTCTNMMISYLGGTDAVNKRLADLGLVHTRIRNWLPDLTGTNTITPYEMVTILSNIDHGPLISGLSRDNGIQILESTHNRRLLVSPLPGDAKVAHKTGDIATAIGDSAVVYMPDGRKYYLSIQVERPYNDYTPRDLVQQASRMVYDYVAAQPIQDKSLQAASLPPL